MQKKLKLSVMALFIAATALAQVEEPKQSEAGEDVVSEQAFTFTEAQLGDDEDVSQNVTIISSNQNIYASTVGFLFSPARFRYRAFNQKYNEIYINGVSMNDLESGQFRYSLVGGLNRITNRSREAALPFEFTNFAMPGMGGSNNYDFRPSKMATGQYVGVAGANRNYTVRGQYAFNTGLRPDGWALSASVAYRWANMQTAYVPGTFYNSLSYYLGAEKKLNDKHSLSLVTWGNPTERAAQGPSTDEMFWLANTYFYNPNWGYQDGKKRSARVVNDFAPTAMLTWDWKIGQDTKLTTALTGRYSYYKTTRLNYNNSENPKPDYWKNLPSSYYDVWYEDDAAGRTAAGYNDFMRAWTYLSGSEEARQIQWDRLYYANQQGNLNGSDAMYFMTARYNNNINLALASTLNTKLGKNTSLNVGLQLAANMSQNYQKIDDLLGANHVSNINTYALGNYPMGDPHVYYDMRNQTAQLKEGDKYAFDYNLNTRKAQLWSSLKFGKGNYQGFLAGRIGGVTMQRDGKMENGIAVAQGNGVTSYGKSGTGKFLDGGAKLGITSHTLSKYGITWNVGVGFEYRAPTPKTAFVSPEVNNDFVKNLRNERVFSSEAGLQYETTWVKANVSGYYSRINDATEWQQFFDDDACSFTYVSMTDIQKEYYGLEWGLKFKLSPSFSIKTLGTVSDAKNVNNANVVYMKSTEGTYHQDIVFNKNMREGGTPLTALNLTLSYNAKGWFIDVMGNYYDRIYLSYSPSYRYGSTLLNRQRSYENSGIEAEKVFETTASGEKVLLDQAVEQAKGHGGFMLDLSIGKSIRMKKGQLSVNFSVTNVLNNRKIVTGGFEQSRSNYSVNSTTGDVGSTRVYKFNRNPYKFYSYGINGMLNIGYRF
ncbi:MAG: TonB-dependent receptor [Prevotella sp.]|nr:TonB-dependent receptor [Prevotella sp.]